MEQNAQNIELKSLYSQIQKIYESFRAIRGEAVGILEASEMPDSKSQLDDVLASTENATVAIINHVSTIGGIVAESSLDDVQKQTISEHVSQVYEACGFQDITGQRIKKVLSRLQILEEQLMRLSSGEGAIKSASENTAHVGAKKNTDDLLNGPQLDAAQPNQKTIDSMFNSS